MNKQEENQKLHQLKRLAIELFGETRHTCNKCGSRAYEVYTMSGNPTTMKKCSNCQSTDVSSVWGWEHYVFKLKDL